MLGNKMDGRQSIDMAVIRNGSCLNGEQQISLCRAITPRKLKHHCSVFLLPSLQGPMDFLWDSSKRMEHYQT